MSQPPKKKRQSKFDRQQASARTRHESRSPVFGVPEEIVELPRNKSTRLLYANPVCFLTTSSAPRDDENGSAGTVTNVQTISWVTPLDNDGHVLMSQSIRRHSHSILKESGRCVLNVATQQHADLLALVGSCSGRNTNKFDEFNIQTCAPGWEGTSSDVAFVDCVAHVVLKVLSCNEQFGHAVWTCEIERAFVRKDCWNGKQLVPPEGSELLSFLGSMRFATINPLPELSVD
ncbi:MAG: hypothetical protein MHM6MM_002759 [Cercozoa sp. M6MM]